MDSGELAKAWTGKHGVIGYLQLELVEGMANHFQSSETKLAKVRFDQLDIRPNVSATSSPNLVWKKPPTLQSHEDMEINARRSQRAAQMKIQPSWSNEKGGWGAAKAWAGVWGD